MKNHRASVLALPILLCLSMPPTHSARADNPVPATPDPIATPNSADTPTPAVTPTPTPSAKPAAPPRPALKQTLKKKDDKFPSWGATISANVPHPVFFEFEHRFSRAVSVGLGGGGLALNNLNIGSIPVKIDMAAVDARVRWHPWNGAFFLGVAAGYQKLSGAGTENIPVTVGSTTTNINTTVTANIASVYVTPHLGYLWVFGSGFTIGFDLGVQVPLNPKTSFDISTDNNIANIGIDLIQQTQAYQDLQNKVDDDGNKLGKIPLPYFTVLRLGWMF